MKKETLKLYWCKKLNCKMTRSGCKSLQKRAKLQKDLERGIVNEKTIKYLLDPLPHPPCPCSNPITRA